MAGPAIAAGLVAAGALGNMFSGKAAAGAQKDIAEQNLAFQLATQGQAVNLAVVAAQKGTPDINDFLAAKKQIDASERGVERLETLIGSLDPALIAAGTEVKKLIEGQEAKILAPMRAERARQRANLIGRLRAEQGEGFELSTAGQAALQRFDEKTVRLETEGQQSALQSVTQFIVGASSARPKESAVTTLAGTEFGIRDLLRKAELHARTIPINALLGAATPQSQDISPQLTAQAQQSFFDTFTTLGTVGLFKSDFFGSGASKGAAGGG